MTRPVLAWTLTFVLFSCISSTSAQPAAYVFRDKDNKWEPDPALPWLQAPSPQGGAVFGYAASIDNSSNGFRVLAGAYIENMRAGAAYIFEHDGTFQRLQSNLPLAGDLFGLSVSLGGDQALIGAAGVDNVGAPTSSSAIVTRTRGPSCTCCKPTPRRRATRLATPCPCVATARW